jgi:hypothetical protein
MSVGDVLQNKQRQFEGSPTGLSAHDSLMMVPTLLKPSRIAVKFGKAQATREAFDPLGRALPGTVLFRVEDKMRAGEMLTRCRTLP